MTETASTTVEWYSPETLAHTEALAEELRELADEFEPDKVVVDNYWDLIRAFEDLQPVGGIRYYQGDGFRPFVPLDTPRLRRSDDETSELETIIGSSSDEPRLGAEYRINLYDRDTPYSHHAELGIAYSVAKKDFDPPREISLFMRPTSRYVDPEAIRFEGMYLQNIGDIHEREGMRKRVSIDANPEDQATFLAGVNPDMGVIRDHIEKLHTGHERNTDIEDSFAKIVELSGGRATDEELEQLHELMMAFAKLNQPEPNDVWEVKDRCEGVTKDFESWARQFGVETDSVYYWQGTWSGHTLNVWKDDIAIDWTGAQVKAGETHPMVYRLGDEEYIYHRKMTTEVTLPNGKGRVSLDDFLDMYNHGQPHKEQAELSAV